MKENETSFNWRSIYTTQKNQKKTIYDTVNSLQKTTEANIVESITELNKLH